VGHSRPVTGLLYLYLYHSSDRCLRDLIISVGKPKPVIIEHINICNIFALQIFLSPIEFSIKQFLPTAFPLFMAYSCYLMLHVELSEIFNGL
jgi:hypothetical protein